MKTVAVYMFQASNEYHHLVGYFQMKAGESMGAFVARIASSSGRSCEHLTTTPNE